MIIGDRRAYPLQQSYVTCESVDEVATAIKDMVTQGGGPWLSAVNAMRIVSSKYSDTDDIERLLPELKRARDVLAATRPTNTAIQLRLDEVLTIARQAVKENQPVDKAIEASISQTLQQIYDDYAVRARAMANLISDGDGILTHCFAEAAFILALAFAARDGKNIRVYTPETRPYFQGAKLTAPSIREIGVDVNLITDSMPAHIMSEGKIQKYITAADMITGDGHVVNKIGTFQHAIAAHAHGIPFYAFAWGRDERKLVKADIEIEERDPAEVRLALGMPTTIDSINARYPTFDITPPKYVAGVVTVHGVLSPYTLNSYQDW